MLMPSWKDWNRFFAKVHIPEDPKGCWGWTGSKLHGTKSDGDYGVFSMTGKQTVAHRLTYRWFKGEIPSHLEMDHLCRNRSCVNPDHLEAVTRQVNLRRGISANRQKTHCPRGHEFTVENTLLKRTSKGYLGRQCRTCRRIQNSESRDRIRKEKPEQWKAQWRRWYEARKIAGTAYKPKSRKDLEG